MRMIIFFQRTIHTVDHDHDRDHDHLKYGKIDILSKLQVTAKPQYSISNCFRHSIFSLMYRCNDVTMSRCIGQCINVAIY
jgi:hypothetical protein